MDYLVIYAMFKRETPWLAEWVTYHRLIGVDRFYLFDSEPTEESERVLRPFAKDGLVKHDQIGGYNMSNQVQFYSSWNREATGRCVWAAFIDLDEFLFPVVGDNLAELLAPYEAFAALSLNWQLFGSSGLQQRPHSALASFVWRARDYYPTNRFVKVITRPEHVSHFTSAHSVVTRDGRECVNENFRAVPGPYSTFTGKKMRINHYCVRSREDYQVKASRSRPGKCSEIFWKLHDRNDVFDESARVRFWPKVQAALKEQGRTCCSTPY